MTESGIRQGHGVSVPYEYALRDVFHLLTIVGASPWFDSLPSHAQQLRSDLQECEVRRLLLTVAVMVRNSMDSHGAFRICDLVGLEELKMEDSVGQLTQNDGQQISDLTLREASNKILHARDLTFDYRADLKVVPPGTALNPTVFAYGEHNGKDWKATVDVVRFCDLAIYAL